MAVEYRFFSARESASRDLYDKVSCVILRRCSMGEHPRLVGESAAI